MRKLSVTKKSVKATSAFYERPAKERQPHIDKYVEICCNCNKPECKKGYCELTGGRK